jgi:hypothetical protein
VQQSDACFVVAVAQSDEKPSLCLLPLHGPVGALSSAGSVYCAGDELVAILCSGCIQVGAATWKETVPNGQGSLSHACRHASCMFGCIAELMYGRWATLSAALKHALRSAEEVHTPGVFC